MHIRTLFFIAALCLTIAARENPFFPVSNSHIPNYSTNKPSKLQPFESLSIEMPDTVRILKSVTLTYENLDGSIMTKKIPVNKAIDWHNRILIAQVKKKR